MKRIKVAVLDSGIDTTHKFFKGKSIKTLSVIKGDFGKDKTNHGTPVSYIIFKKAPNIDLVSIKVLGANGQGSCKNVVRGIKKAIDLDCDVINLSLGTTFNYKPLEKIVKECYEKNIIVVCASGNSGNDTSSVDYPGKYPTSISVGAVKNKKEIAKFSSAGKRVDFCAIGYNVLAAGIGGKMCRLSGTSFACSVVTGIIVRLLQAYPVKLNRIDCIRYALQVLAKDLGKSGKDRLYGFGYIGYLFPSVGKVGINREV